MKYNHYLAVLLGTSLLVSAPLTMAMSKTSSTLVGAAIGGVAGNAIGDNLSSTLIGAAAGGLLGHLLNHSDPDYDREGFYRNHYYYGGRRFDNQRDYEAYRRAVDQGMLKDQERRRYQDYDHYRRHNHHHDNNHYHDHDRNHHH